MLAAQSDFVFIGILAVLLIPFSIFVVREKQKRLPEDEQQRIRDRSTTEKVFGSREQLPRTIITIVLVVVAAWLFVRLG